MFGVNLWGSLATVGVDDGVLGTVFAAATAAMAATVALGAASSTLTVAGPDTVVPLTGFASVPLSGVGFSDLPISSFSLGIVLIDLSKFCSGSVKHAVSSGVTQARMALLTFKSSPGSILVCR